MEVDYKVYSSPKEAFEKRVLEVREAQKNGDPIFTPNSYGAFIAVDEDTKWRLRNMSLVHEQKDYEPPEHDYENTPILYTATYNSIIRKMPDANKDEIFLFLATADPKRLDDEEMQRALFTRFAELQKNDMVAAIVNHQNPADVATEHAEEVGTIASYFEAMKNAVQVDGNYFASDYMQSDAQ